MAPPSGAGKRVKGTQVFRPFIYGTTARPFDDKTNPKPAGVPDDHTHSWQVFVKGVDDTDITYWLKRVQFKLHESIPNHVRMIDGEPGKPFVVNETGWGEFEITIKLYYVSESGEKPQTLYHHLRLHPYGRTDAEREAMRENGEVVAWTYEEQVFNEPYEAFYEVLTSGATGGDGGGGGGGKGGGGGGKAKGKGAKHAAAAAHQPKRTEGGVLERSAMIPLTTRPGHPFSREAEQLEIQKLKDAQAEVERLTKVLAEELKEKEEKLKNLRAEAEAAA
ncbi:Histone acetyltransferase subunit [Pleurostoma richardsiae]|uniref:Protein AF-9 homolog n=1 Tax=Pleurostoma richardsiae TaxID=41990 RepID=A0AA38S9J2_9PEZI|nr:Histone acetyltransferase subunit [Pleurostoma richardsiae]